MKIPGYSIEQRIGHGGMAVVYRAVQESLGRPVALKVMNPLLSDTAEFTQRFFDEARMLAAVHHPNIITIYDIGVSDDLHFLSMEYVEGGDLRSRIAAGMSPQQATEYLITLARCLAAAHAKFIVHRDIKPANILFHADGTLLLSDFGIAKRLTASKELTMAGSVVGSPHYLSPEQAQGRAVDGRADIYSLGILYYEMLTGRRPFVGGSDIDTASRHVTETMPELPQRLALYRGIVERMTDKDPDARFPSCESLLSALGELTAAGTWSGNVTAIPLPAAPRCDEPQSVVVEAASGEAVPASPLERPPCGSGTRRQAPGTGTVLTGCRGGTTGADADTALNGLVLDAGQTALSPALQDQETVIGPPPSAFGARRRTLWAGALVAVAVTALVWGVPATRTVLLDAEEPSAGQQGSVGDERTVLAAEATTWSRAETQAARHAAQAQAEAEAQVQAARQARLERIEALLTRARAAFDDYRLTTPRRTSAFTYYQEVLELDPGNARAASGIKAIARRYLHMARSAERKWDYDKARRFVASGLKVHPGHAELRQMERRLRASSGTAEESLKKTFKDVKGWFD